MTPKDLTLMHVINGEAFDMSHIMLNVRISGRLSTPARSMQVEFLDVPENGRGAISIDPMRGDQVTFSVEGKEIFRGLWMKAQRSNKRTLVATAYDMGIYVSNNKDTFCYECPITASDVFRDVCGRFGISMGQVDDSGYAISNLAKSKTSGWDVISKALEQTYDATSRRFAVHASEGKLNFLEREKNMLMWVVEDGVNLQSWSESVSTEKLRTRIKVYSKDDVVVAEAVNAEIEGRLGRMQDIESASDDKLCQGSAQEIANNALKNLCKADESLSITATGIPEVISGTALVVAIKDFDRFRRVCYVAEDTHHWDGMKYTMQLKLNIGPPVGGSGEPPAEPDPEPVEPPQPQPVYYVYYPCTVQSCAGRTVMFSGGYHYVSSDASSPTGGPRSAGAAQITKTARGARHPYHLIGAPGGSNVYGWVDEGTFS